MVQPDDVAAAFATFAEHCQPGGLLLVQTLMDTPELDRMVAFTRESR